MTAPNPFASAPALLGEACAADPRPTRALRRHQERVQHLRPGLSVHADETVDAVDQTAHGRIDAGLRLLVLLDGSVDVSYGDRRLQMTSSREEGRCAALVQMAQAGTFTRRLRRGKHARRVSVTMGRDWLAQLWPDGANGGPLDALLAADVAVHPFDPTPRVLALAAQLASAPPGPTPWRHLYLESRALALVAEVLRQLAQDGAPAALPSNRLPLRDAQRMQTVFDFLQSEAALGLSLDAIADHVGMHVSTLQRHFRLQYGTSVVECARDARLLRARRALERDRVSVGQAAELAGYSSPANFATAYRRRFGVPPKWSRDGF